MIRRQGDRDASFPTAEDREISGEAERVAAEAEQLCDWLARFAAARQGDSLAEISNADQLALLDLRRQAGALRASARLPVAAAVYGPSQVGKSLFIGQVLRTAAEAGCALGREDAADATPDRLSFEADLNPQCGDNEATALVTRFTTSDRLSKNWPARYPVVARALSRAQWLCVVARGFQVECRAADTTWTEETLAVRLAELGGEFAAPQADASWRSDLLDAYAYVRETNRLRYRFELSALNRLLAAHPLSAGGYCRLAGELFWDAWGGLSEVFQRGCSFLAQLQDQPAAGDAGTSGPTDGESAIALEWAAVRFLLDTQRSPEFCSPAFGRAKWADFRLSRQPGEAMYVLARRSGDLKGGPSIGNELSADLATIQAALLEVVIPVLPARLNEDWQGVLERMDLLDIPGMRVGRAGGPDAGKRSRADTLEEQLEIVKRGKVAYLFERYSQDRLVQTLLVLARGGNLEVTGYLKAHIETWGRSRYAERWPLRVPDSPPALFIGLTGIDAEFRNRSEPPVPALYDARLKQLRDALHPLLDSFGGAEFANIYPLRYPGTWDSDHAARQNEGQAKWLAAGQAFVGSSFVQRHVAEAQLRWDAAMCDGDGGLSLISAGFLSCTQAFRKRDQVRAGLRHTSQALVDLARRWYLPENPRQSRQPRIEHAGKVLRWLCHVARWTPCRLYALKQSLAISADDVAELADLADVRRLPLLEGRLPLEHRLHVKLAAFCEDWAAKQAPARWTAYMSALERPDPAQFEGIFSPVEFDAADFARYAAYVQDYLRSADQFERIIDALLPIVRLRGDDEAVLRHARRNYVQLVLNDCFWRPGIGEPVEILGEESPPRVEIAPGSFGLWAGFLHSWQRRLPAALAAGAAGPVRLPAGNAELGRILAQSTAAATAEPSAFRIPVEALCHPA